MRVLCWAGAALPLFHPDRGEVREMRDALRRGSRVDVRLDDRERHRPDGQVRCRGMVMDGARQQSGLAAA